MSMVAVSKMNVINDEHKVSCVYALCSNATNETIAGKFQPCFHNIYLRFDRLADSPFVGLVRLHTVNAFMICCSFVSGFSKKAWFFYRKTFSCTFSLVRF